MQAAISYWLNQGVVKEINVPFTDESSGETREKPMFISVQTLERSSGLHTSGQVFDRAAAAKLVDTSIEEDEQFERFAKEHILNILRDNRNGVTLKQIFNVMKFAPTIGKFITEHKTKGILEAIDGILISKD